MLIVVFVFKQKTALELRISDWSSDVCSSDLKRDHRGEKFDVLACHFQFWDKAKCFTEWPHQSTRGKVAPSIILRCYELACLPRVTQGLEPPLLGQRRLWP